MTDDKKPKIFLSYSWANTDIADEIDADFKKNGINLTRDVRDLGFRKSIKEFMHTIGKHDYVLMLVSDEYLRSENRMYEVTELLGTHEFRERILPIVHDNARQIFEAMGSAVYLEYWKTKKQEAHKYNRKHANQVSLDVLKKITRIQNEVDDFFTKLVDLNIYSLTHLKQQNYQPLLDIIGFEDEHELEYWKRIKDSEKIEEFDTYLSVYPKGKFVNEVLEKISLIKKLIEEKELWEEAIKENGILKWRAFINKYPNSRYLPEANKKLRYLTEIENKLPPRKSSYKIGITRKTRVLDRLIVIIGILLIISISGIVAATNKWWPFNNIPMSPDTTKIDSAKMDPNKITENLKKIAAGILGTRYELTDNFDDNHNNWVLENDSIGKMSIINGKLIIRGLISKRTTNNCSAHNNIAFNGDFFCAVDAKAIGGIEKDQRDYGLEFKADNGNEYDFGIVSSTYSISYKKEGEDDWHYIKQWTKSDLINKRTPNTLTVEYRNSRLYFYINDLLVNKYPLKNLTTSKFGLYAGGEQIVEFDNFRLEGTRKLP